MFRIKLIYSQQLKDKVYSRISVRNGVLSLGPGRLSMIPAMIRKNAETFGRSIAKKRGDQRVGDQYGILLAGAFSLTSDGLISEEVADKFIDEQDWLGDSITEGELDEIRCLNHILQYVLSVNQDHRRVDRSITELVAIAADIEDPARLKQDAFDETMPTEVVSITEAKATLVRSGFKINEQTNELVVSDYHTSIEKILHDSPWQKGWGRSLKRIKGSTTKSTFRFGHGLITRATGIPLTTIFGSIEEDNNLKEKL